MKLHLGSRQVTQPAFQPGDYHDLLAELRTNFLIDGEEESGQLLDSLATGGNATASYGTAALTLLLYGAAATTAAAILFSRRDVVT